MPLGPRQTYMIFLSNSNFDKWYRMKGSGPEAKTALKFFLQSYNSRFRFAVHIFVVGHRNAVLSGEPSFAFPCIGLRTAKADKGKKAAGKLVRHLVHALGTIIKSGNQRIDGGSGGGGLVHIP
jgi:hypothetical protein